MKINVLFHKKLNIIVWRKCLQQVIVEVKAPQLCHNIKKAFKIAQKMCKCVQAKKGEVLTTLKMLEDYKKKPRYSKRKK